MIFHELIPPDKFKVGGQYKVIGPWTNTIIIKTYSKSATYCFVDNRFDGWTKHGFWHARDQDDYQFVISSPYLKQPIKEFLCNRISRIIPT
jgi:hypothetical protein